MRGWKWMAALLGVVALASIGLAATVALATLSIPHAMPWAGDVAWGANAAMMGGYGHMGPPGMMPYGFGQGRGAPALTPEQARGAAQRYLDSIGSADLEIRDVMVFTNHAYIQFSEKTTGIGAFEALVDPATSALAPEPGPNMMWNLKYGPMAGGALPGMGMMMGGWMMGSGYGMMPISGGQALSLRSPGDMPVSAAEAATTAQQYLDAYLPGLQTDPEAAAFYGYYTVDTLRDGEPAGMLSVNGFTRQVWVHFWHGDFISESEG